MRGQPHGEKGNKIQVVTPNLQAQLSRRSSRRTVPKALRLLHPRCCPESLLTGAAAHALVCSAASTTERAAAAAPGATVWGPLSLLRSHSKARNRLERPRLPPSQAQPHQRGPQQPGKGTRCDANSAAEGRISNAKKAQSCC